MQRLVRGENGTSSAVARPIARALAVVAAILLAPAIIRAERPNEDEHIGLNRGLAELKAELDGLPELTKFKHDAAICFKAVEWQLRYEEWVHKNAVKNAQATLKAGQDRVIRMKSGDDAVALKPGKHILAYRSNVDGSLQPYAIGLPEGWKPGDGKKWPLYVVLHGRGDDMNESSFINTHNNKPPVKDSTWIQLDVYGRGNNAYRWAGESDVFEALADVKKRFLIDERRVTLWGFSMGGAGAWHLGLQHPDLWSSVGAGAGFVDFYKYQKVEQKLPEVQDKMLRIYDSVDYALNLFDVPFVSYGGELDPQLASTLMMQDAARQVNAPMSAIIGRNMGHKFDDMSQKTFQSFLAAHSQQGQPEFPGRRELKFVTYTLKFNKCDWLRIEEQVEPYERTEVISTYADNTLKVTTENVRALAIARGVADAVVLDGGKKVMLADAAGGNLPDVSFVLEAGGWKTLSYDESERFAGNPDEHKRPGLQGPIDDAFSQPFVLVQGTGKPWNEAHETWAETNLDRVAGEWSKWFRGDLKIVADTVVTEKEIDNRNLVLFGDPGSNVVIAKIADRLPLKWTKDSVMIGGKSYPTANHGVVLIFPNPLNPRRYVVLNSGPTVRAEEYKKSNAWFFPRLGDAAVLQFEKLQYGGFSETPVWSTIMNSEWEIEP